MGEILYAVLVTFWSRRQGGFQAIFTTWLSFIFARAGADDKNTQFFIDCLLKEGEGGSKIKGIM